jgi:DNA mismatch endonuclease (patch repair protein)
MPDKFSKATRSRIMAAVRGKDTKPEVMVRQALSAKGYKYKKNYRLGKKTIDIALPKRKVAILVDGCFWHGCPSCYKEPKSNKAYWRHKIDANIHRDKITNRELRRAGWKVIRLWEHELNEDKARSMNKVYLSIAKRGL